MLGFRSAGQTCGSSVRRGRKEGAPGGPCHAALTSLTAVSARALATVASSRSRVTAWTSRCVATVSGVAVTSERPLSAARASSRSCSSTSDGGSKSGQAPSTARGKASGAKNDSSSRSVRAPGCSFSAAAIEVCQTLATPSGTAAARPVQCCQRLVISTWRRRRGGGHGGGSLGLAHAVGPWLIPAASSSERPWGPRRGALRVSRAPLPAGAALVREGGPGDGARQGRLACVTCPGRPPGSCRDGMACGVRDDAGHACGGAVGGAAPRRRRAAAWRLSVPPCRRRPSRSAASRRLCGPALCDRLAGRAGHALRRGRGRPGPRAAARDSLEALCAAHLRPAHGGHDPPPSGDPRPRLLLAAGRRPLLL